MGETAHWDEFRDHDDRTGAILGNVAPGARILFGQSFDSALRSLAKEAANMDLRDIAAQETPGGRFDIKNDKTVAPNGPNTGELLNGTYAMAVIAPLASQAKRAAISCLEAQVSAPVVEETGHKTGHSSNFSNRDQDAKPLKTIGGPARI